MRKGLLDETNTHWLTKGEFKLLDDGPSLSSLTNTDFFLNPLDGELYPMTRLAWVPMDQKIKLGFGVQSPAGGSVTVYFRAMSLRESTPSDLRNLNSSDLTDNPVYYTE